MPFLLSVCFSYSDSFISTAVVLNRLERYAEASSLLLGCVQSVPAFYAVWEELLINASFDKSVIILSIYTFISSYMCVFIRFIL